MSLVYRDRAWCIRSDASAPAFGREVCVNASCDRFVDETVLRLSAKAKQPIGWADLKTSKCGFVPREGENR